MKFALLVAVLTVAGFILFFLRHNHSRINIPFMSQFSTDNLRSTHFVFARILDTVLPIERGEKYEDPLDAMLQQQHLGEVTGGGTMQRKDNTIEYIGVDIELVDLDSALNATKAKLRELGAPKGSVLEFQRDGQKAVVPIHDN